MNRFVNRFLAVQAEPVRIGSTHWKKWKIDRVEKRAEKVREAAVKAVRKTEREAGKAKKQKKRRVEAVGGADQDKENVSPNVSVAVSEMAKKPRYVCSVLQGSRGDVLRLRGWA